MKKYLGKHNKSYYVGEFKNYFKRKRTRIISSILASALIIPIASFTQFASGYTDSRVGLLYNYKRDKDLEYRLGPLLDDDKGNHVAYCIESGTDFRKDDNYWQPVYDNDFRIAATMIQHEKTSFTDFIPAGVAYAIHDHLDLNPEQWKKIKEAGFSGDHQELVGTSADQSWNYAKYTTPVKVSSSQKYTNGKREGVLHISLLNVDNSDVRNIHVLVKSTNNLVSFDKGKTTFEGTTGDEAKLDVPWVAQGDGNAQITVSYEGAKPERLYSGGQDAIRSVENTWYDENIPEFEVEKTFDPTLTAKISNRELAVGEKVDTTVKSGVTGNNIWPEDVLLRAEGYYFVGSANDVLHLQESNSGESANKYLNRLRSLPNVRQVAAAKTNFSETGQTETPYARRLTGDINDDDFNKAEQYKVTKEEAGLFGTWVWVIKKEEQKSNSSWLKGDTIQAFGVAETTSANKGEVGSDFAPQQQIVGLGTEVVNEITVHGLPESYGSFKGDEKYGFSKDQKAHIRVWWSGAGTNNPTKKDNDRYKPGAKGEPRSLEPKKEDEHHHLIGNWEVPAVNGVYEIGNGFIVLKPVASMDRSEVDPVTLAENVHIRADENSKSGWYTFIYDFPGSSRAKAYKSQYNNPWGSTYVSPNEVKPASVTTTVNNNNAGTQGGKPDANQGGSQGGSQGVNQGGKQDVKPSEKPGGNPDGKKDVKPSEKPGGNPDGKQDGKQDVNPGAKPDGKPDGKPNVSQNGNDSTPNSNSIGKEDTHNANGGTSSGGTSVSGGTAGNTSGGTSPSGTSTNTTSGTSTGKSEGKPSGTSEDKPAGATSENNSGSYKFAYSVEDIIKMLNNQLKTDQPKNNQPNNTFTNENLLDLYKFAEYLKKYDKQIRQLADSANVENGNVTTTDGNTFTLANANTNANADANANANADANANANAGGANANANTNANNSGVSASNGIASSIGIAGANGVASTNGNANVDNSTAATYSATLGNNSSAMVSRGSSDSGAASASGSTLASGTNGNSAASASSATSNYASQGNSGNSSGNSSASSSENNSDGQAKPFENPGSLATTGSSSMLVMLLAIVTLTFAAGVSLGRFVKVNPQHKQSSYGRHGGVMKVRRLL